MKVTNMSKNKIKIYKHSNLISNMVLFIYYLKIIYFKEDIILQF